MLSAIILLTVITAPRSGQQGSGSYDPWLDYDENGAIDVRELYRLGEAYGSVGNTTRNVTIAGHVTAYLRPGGENLSISGFTHGFSGLIPVDGYAKVTVLIWVSSASSCEYYFWAYDNDGNSWLVEFVDPAGQSWVKTYDVMNQRIQIEINNWGSTAITAKLAVYLVA
jgi:hypothetical protein